METCATLSCSFLPTRTGEIGYGICCKSNFTHSLHELRLTVAVDFFSMLKGSSKIFLAHKDYFVSLVQTLVKIICCAEHGLSCLLVKSSRSRTDETVFACCFCSWNSCVTHLKFEKQKSKLQLLKCMNTCTINEDNQKPIWSLDLFWIKRSKHYHVRNSYSCRC